MVRRLLIVLLSLVLLVVAAVGGALALLAFDADLIKGPATRLVSAQLGREVTIAGPLDIGLGRVVTLDASGVRVANPEWAASPALADIGRVRVGVDLGAYLSDRRIVVTELRLERPKIDLERDAQGRATWELGDGKAAPAEPAASQDSGGGAPTLPEIRELAISDGGVAYKDAVTEVDVATTFGTEPPKPGAATGDFGGLKLDGKGSVRGGPLAFALEVGSPALLTQGGTPFPIKGTLDLAGTHVALDGSVRDPLALKGLTLALDLASPDPTRLLALAGQKLDHAPPNLGLKAKLAREDAAFDLSGLDASWGRSRITGGASFDPTAARPKVTADLRAPLVDVAELQPALGGRGGAEPAAKPEPATGGTPDLSPLAAYDADVRLAADLVRLAQGPEIRDIAVTLKLVDGHLVVDPLQASLPQGKVTGRAEIASVKATPVTTAVSLKAEGVGLAPLLAAFGQDVAGRLDGTVEGTLRGLDPDTLLAQSALALKAGLAGGRYAKAPATLTRGDVELRLADGKATLDPLRLELPQGRLEGRVATGPLAPMLGGGPVEATLDLRTPAPIDLAPLLVPAVLPKEQGFAGRFTGGVTGTVRGDAPTPEAIVAGSDLALKGQLDGLRVSTLRTKVLAFDGRLAQGRVTVDPLRLDLEQGGGLTGKVATGPVAGLLKGGEPPEVTLDLTAQALDLAAFLGPDGPAGGVLGGRLTGTVRGTAPADIMARSRIDFAGRLDRPRLPQVGDRLGNLALFAALHPDDKDRPVHAAADGRLGDMPLHVEARGGAPAILLAGKGAYPLGLDAAVGDTKASVTGTVTLPADAKRADLALKASGPGTRPLMAALGLSPVDLPAYTLAANLAQRGPATTVSGIDAKVGRTDLAGQVALKTDGPRPAVTGDLRSKVLDYDELMAGLGGSDQQVAKPAQPQQGASDPFDPKVWRQLDADVRLAAQEVRAAKLPLDGLDTRIALKDGLLRVEPVTLRLGEGQTTGWVQLDARKAPAAARMDLSMTKLPVGRLLAIAPADSGRYGTLTGAASGGAALAGGVPAVKDLLKEGDGKAKVLVQNGILSRELGAALGFDVMKLVTIFPGASPPEVKLACAGAELGLANGQLDVPALALDTALAAIGGKGSFNLNANTVAMQLAADPRGVAAVAAGRAGISVEGPISAPRVGLDAGRLSLGKLDPRKLDPGKLDAGSLAGAALGAFLGGGGGQGGDRRQQQQPANGDADQGSQAAVAPQGGQASVDGCVGPSLEAANDKRQDQQDDGGGKRKRRRDR